MSLLIPSGNHATRKRALQKRGLIVYPDASCKFGLDSIRAFRVVVTQTEPNFRSSQHNLQVPITHIDFVGINHSGIIKTQSTPHQVHWVLTSRHAELNLPSEPSRQRTKFYLDLLTKSRPALTIPAVCK
jgi:hypothetical protein